MSKYWWIAVGLSVIFVAFAYAIDGPGAAFGAALGLSISAALAVVSQ